MKIIVSKRGRETTAFFLFMLFVATAGMIILCADSVIKGENIKEALVVFFLTAGIADAICGGMMMGVRRLSTSVKADGSRLTSYSFFGKKLCTVNTEKPTYFAMFRWGEGQGAIPYLIALSNKPFAYQPFCGNAKVHFVWRYSMKDILILPYSESTTSMLDLEKCFNVRRCEAEKLKADLSGGLCPPLNLINPNSAEEDYTGVEGELGGRHQEQSVKKIVLSRRWRDGARLYLALMILAAFVLVGICVFARHRVLHLFILLAVIYELMLCGLLFGLKRRSTYAKLKGDKLTSYSLLGKSLCTLDLNRPIYFAIFEASSIGLDVYLVALSATLFTHRIDNGEGRNKKDFLQCYDMKSIILLPYDTETVSVLHMGKWYNVHSEGGNQMPVWGTGLYPPVEK